MPKNTLVAAHSIRSNTSLLDLLDHLLNKGVVAYGDVVLSVADLDLVYLNLRAVLSGIGTLEKVAGFNFGDNLPEKESAFPIEKEEINTGACSAAFLSEPGDSPNKTFIREQGPAAESCIDTEQKAHIRTPDPEIHSLPGRPKPGQRLELDPKKAEQGLAKLALCIINLLRKLMERQAIRRMEAGTLTNGQVERASQAFQRIEESITELRRRFELKEEDLNLDLGPLGPLV